MFQELSKIFLNLGIVLIVFGSLLWLLGRLPFLGKLPGDFLVKRENFTLYAPVVTMLLVSLFFSLILTIVSLFRR